MTTTQFKSKKEEIVLPSSVTKKLGVSKKDKLSYKIIDKDTVEVKVQRDKDIQKDPLLKAICNPARVKLKVTTRYLNKLREELWTH
jgi:hypothetical protein